MGFYCKSQERKIRKFSKSKLVERVKSEKKYVCVKTRRGSVLINSVYLRLLMDESIRLRLKR